MAQSGEQIYNSVFYDRLVELYVDKRLNFFFKKPNIKTCIKCGNEFVVKKRHPRAQCGSCETKARRLRWQTTRQ